MAPEPPANALPENPNTHPNKDNAIAAFISLSLLTGNWLKQEQFRPVLIPG